jgi:hypothetical protein
MIYKCFNSFCGDPVDMTFVVVVIWLILHFIERGLLPWYMAFLALSQPNCTIALKMTL